MGRGSSRLWVGRQPAQISGFCGRGTGSRGSPGARICRRHRFAGGRARLGPGAVRRGRGRLWAGGRSPGAAPASQRSVLNVLPYAQQIQHARGAKARATGAEARVIQVPMRNT